MTKTDVGGDCSGIGCVCAACSGAGTGGEGGECESVVEPGVLRSCGLTTLPSFLSILYLVEFARVHSLPIAREERSDGANCFIFC